MSKDSLITHSSASVAVCVESIAIVIEFPFYGPSLFSVLLKADSPFCSAIVFQT
jgi:hypothetical protein